VDDCQTKFIDQRKVRWLFVGKCKLKARSSTCEHCLVVIRARRSGSPFSTSINIHCLPWFEVTFTCIRQRRKPPRIATFHCVTDRTLVIKYSRRSLGGRHMDLILLFLLNLMRVQRSMWPNFVCMHAVEL